MALYHEARAAYQYEYDVSTGEEFQYAVSRLWYGERRLGRG